MACHYRWHFLRLMGKHRAMENQPKIGQLIISFDFEIGWGVWESELWPARQARGVYRDLRPAMRRFLAFLDDREIALTWATVGAMVTARHSGEFDYLPTAAQAHIARFLVEAEAETVDGRDLFDMVAGTSTPQQIASHSYSHTRFDYIGMTHDAILADLVKSRSAMEELNRPVDALVFPENIIVDWHALAKAGFRVGRTAAPAVRPIGIAPLDHFLARTIARPPMVCDTMRPDGVLEHSGSLFFNWFGKGASLRRHTVIYQAKKAIDHAAKTGGTAHLWLHPFNLTHSVGMADAIEDICTHAHKLAEKGQLQFGRL